MEIFDKKIQKKIFFSGEKNITEFQRLIIRTYMHCERITKTIFRARSVNIYIVKENRRKNLEKSEYNI